MGRRGLVLGTLAVVLFLTSGASSRVAIISRSQEPSLAASN